jgi:glutamate-1-semialdehyde 2,1-aminomutase
MSTTTKLPPATSTSSYRERALHLFPAGSNGEYGIPADLVPVIDRGKGAWVWDTEGDQYLDMTMAWGAALVGHAHPLVLEAITKQAQNGFNFAAVNRRAVELAERITAISPAAEQIRFVASGTEATLLCIRVARNATGKAKILKFEGAYHGQHPIGVASMVSAGEMELPVVDPAGTGAPWVDRDVLVAPYNDLDRTAQILATHADEIAGVIVEPLHRCLKPAPGFLEGLRQATDRHGIVLIFDEVVTGFRLALGGAQEYYGVTPDLVAYGKALGGGFPIGAFGGNADLMQVVNEHRLPGPKYVWSASTTGGNPVSAAAALAAIDIYSGQGFYERLFERGAQLRDGMAAILRELGIAGHILGDGPLAQVAFSETPVTDQRSWLASNRKLGRELMLELLRQKVFLNPMGTKLYISLDHDAATIDIFLDRFRTALQKVAG